MLLCDEPQGKEVDERWLEGRAEACESQRDYAVHGERICLLCHVESDIVYQ